MTNKKNTRRAMLSSAIAVIMCVAMLIGTTFAWFTDTASTAVNKIVSGNLDVDIVAPSGESLVGKTLKWQAEDERAQENILWEPGCTYYLESFSIQNKGNLALKYKVVVNGITGDEKLLEALEFGFDYGWGTPQSLDRMTGTLDAVSEYPGLGTMPMRISVHMKEDAGNEYQGLSIDGIGITVYATQSAYEYDSNDNQYDANAKYTEVVAAGKTFTGTATLTTGITATDPSAVAVKVTGADANVTIEDGTFDGGSNGNNVCVSAVNGAKVTIKDGTFTVGGDADGYGNSVIYTYGGDVVIEGGFFYTDHAWNGFYYVLNQNNNNPGTITVKGGTFVNYNPANGDDNLGGNFVAEGYKVVSETQANGDVWYTVVAE